ncbi:hypothetical protein E4U42_002555 [Claviceps africana]|uniref:Uncharacterized protein n=1 Tax=Claviceps africana TaxID=83212 RepID=A0A8K0J8H7_9HYPO|nr:hypothetical protein E4U42_002555 [Claviceps africana]
MVERETHLPPPYWCVRDKPGLILDEPLKNKDGGTCKVSAHIPYAQCDRNARVFFIDGDKKMRLQAPLEDFTLSAECNGNKYYYHCLAGHEGVWENPCAGQYSVSYLSVLEPWP